MSSNQHQITNLRGERITGTVTLRLKPGIGIQGMNGEHLEGGPHNLPVAIAQQLLDTNRADVVLVETRDPQAENRDQDSRRRR
jgi:hypothetical protein